MLANLVFVFFGLVLGFSCSHRKDNNALLIYLLGQYNGGQSIGDISKPDVQSTHPTTVRLEEIVPGESICSSYGGILVSFQSEERETCAVHDLNSDCAKEGVRSMDSTPLLIDPRSTLGFQFPQSKLSTSISYPSDHKSIFFCYNRAKPNTLQDLMMEASRNRTNLDFDCSGTKQGPFCRDQIPLFSPTNFRIPSEFPIVSNGLSDGHWSQLKYQTEDQFFVVCRYAGEVTNPPIRSYRASVVDLNHKKGVCVKTSGDYYGTDNSTYISEELIPVNSIVTASAEIQLEVNNCANHTYTKISWRIEDWSPVDSSDFPLEIFLAGIVYKHQVVFFIGFLILCFTMFLLKRKK